MASPLKTGYFVIPLCPTGTVEKYFCMTMCDTVKQELGSQSQVKHSMNYLK